MKRLTTEPLTRSSRRLIFRQIIWIVPIFLLCLQGLSAGEKSIKGSVEGFVLAHEKYGRVPDYEIQLKSNSATLKTKTNSDGHYRFENVDPGQYVLEPA